MPSGDIEKPAPKGGAFISVTPSGNSTSAATPSVSRTLSRASASHAPESSYSRPLRHSRLMSATRKRSAASSVTWIWIGSAASKTSRYSGST